jgi:HK97 family phage prohead protease
MEDEKKYEIRSFGVDAAPKILRSEDGTESRTIEGYAIVFNSESQVLHDWCISSRNFIEVIKPGAVNEDLLRSCDIKGLLEHDPSRMIARSFGGKGSLQLSIDSKGLKYRFDAPNTSEGNYALEMVRRGDLFGSSFAYTTDEEVNVTYAKKDENTLMRYVNKIDAMYDISIVSNPAYMATSVATRSLSDKYFVDPIPLVDNSKDIEKLNNLLKKGYYE